MIDLDATALDDATAIPVLREQIDSLDQAIARLVTERSRLSHRIQAARLAAGGVRVELNRERQVREHYRVAVGPAGSGIADAVLRACRGDG